MNKLSSRVLLYLIAIAPLAFSPEHLYAQFFLPKVEVLAENKVKKIKVIKIPLRLEYLNHDTANVKPDWFDQSFDTTHPYTFYLNQQGLLDSVFQWPGRDGFYLKQMMRYDSLFRLVDYASVSANGSQSLSSMRQLEGGGWHLQTLKDGKIREEAWTTADSIVHHRIYYWTHEPTEKYLIDTFDIQNNLKIKRVVHGKRIIKEERYQWIVENNRPQKFIYSIFEQEDPDKKAKHNTHEFRIDSSGWAVNRHTGTIFDPFRFYNYYERFERSKNKAIAQPYAQMFRLDELVDFQEKKELWKFDGTSVIYRYEFHYDD